MVACLSGMDEGLIQSPGHKEGRGRRERRRERGQEERQTEKQPLVALLENSIKSRKALHSFLGRPLSKNVRNMPSLTMKHTLSRVRHIQKSRKPFLTRSGKPVALAPTSGGLWYAGRYGRMGFQGRGP